jgi:hypothetical protein
MTRRHRNLNTRPPRQPQPSTFKPSTFTYAPNPPIAPTCFSRSPPVKFFTTRRCRRGRRALRLLPERRKTNVLKDGISNRTHLRSPVPHLLCVEPNGTIDVVYYKNCPKQEKATFRTKKAIFLLRCTVPAGRRGRSANLQSRSASEIRPQRIQSAAPPHPRAVTGHRSVRPRRPRMPSWKAARGHTSATGGSDVL